MGNSKSWLGEKKNGSIGIFDPSKTETYIGK